VKRVTYTFTLTKTIMAEKTADKIKYRILRFLDVTGFTVFDPIVRLAFREEPQKQMEAIYRYLLVPLIFVTACVALWWVVAPKHKTKSGEVPTPDVVWQAAIINDTFSAREQLKESDFVLAGAGRIAMLAEVELQMESKTAELVVLDEALNAQETAYETQLAARIAPLNASLELLEQSSRVARDVAKEAITAVAAQLEAGQASGDALVAAIRAEREVYDAGRASESVIKEQIDDLRSEKYKPMEAARLDVNAVANEVQFLKKRIDFLSGSNRSIKVAEAQTELDGFKQQLAAATTAKDAISQAKRVIRAEDSIERLETQQYASAMTVYKQIQRSLFTVFVGFILAAVIAIPLGILCGLNRIAMACLTPLISIFKPVSPVVWLLIFQIVVGAFFLDPDSHPLFLFFDSLPWLGTLGINPALIFSACTVAMCAVWPALVNTALGVASIDPDHVNVARVLKLGFWDRLTKIIIPSALPLVFAGLRISLGVGWMVLIAAEALSSSDGLGKFVWDEYQNGSSFSFANILYACFVVGGIGFLLDRMMIILQRFVSFDGGGTSL
jgi:nitrate/nitrite transport system permease protein